VPDGAWFVALDVVAESAQVGTTIARTLGMFDGPGRPAAEGLAPYLASRSVLLVLDNFEHVLDAAPVVATLLLLSPGTRVVVTSRAPLRISGEQEYPVGPLDVGEGATSAAIRLFIERARAVRPGWEPGSEMPVIREICTLIDGLPLGVELAAARISLLPLAALRDRLAQRLPLPGSGRRDVPTRQRTLEDAIAWSFDLLDPAGRRLLEELSVFEGGFDFEQAAVMADAVASAGDGVDVLDAIGRLVEHSLIARDAGHDSGGIRYRMLQTIRTFAMARLVAAGRERELRERHARAYLELAERIAPRLPGRDQGRWLDRLGVDQDNLKAAVRWSIDAGETELALRLVAACWRFWQIDGHLAEGRDLVEEALAMPGATEPTAARLGAITAAGGIAYWRSEPDRAREYYREQLALAEQLGDRAAAADALFNTIFVRYITGELEEAHAAFDETEARFRELGDERALSRMEWVRATLAIYAGSPQDAIPILERQRDIFVAAGDDAYQAMTAGSLAWANWMIGNVQAATSWLVEAVDETRAMRDVANLTITLPGIAIALLEGGNPAQAAVIWGAFDAAREKYGVETPSGLSVLVNRRDPLERMRAALGDEGFESALARGRQMSLDEASDLIVEFGTSVEATPGTPATP
jgi:predicted ATPase